MPNTALSIESHRDAHSRSVIDELNSAVATGGEEQQARILERVADLFAAGSRGYSSDQIALFGDVLQRLAADIEVKARARLAGRLARIGNAPHGLIRALAFDDAIEVAAPVLICSPQLSDADLVESATTKSQDHLFAIAQRIELSETVTDILVERGDRRVVRKVVKNKGARFSLAGYGKLTTRSRADRTLALALGRRKDLPREYFLKLLETASASVRAKLEAINPHAAAAIRDTVDDVATALQQEARQASRRHARAMRDAKRRFHLSRFAEANVHAPARAQSFERTLIALARFGRFPLDLVERALVDKGEDMILILARAAGCSWTTARELLLMYAAERKLQPEDLARALERYEKLSEATARRITNFYLQRRERRSGEAAPAEAADAAAPVAEIA